MSTSRTSFSVHLTARDSGARLLKLPDVASCDPAEVPLSLATVSIDDRLLFQEIEGFGGAFTEAMTVTLDKMPAERREEALRAYFDPATGHGYNFCRVHMGSCDFALGNYAHCDTPGDHALVTFNIDRDRESLLPAIKRAQEIPGGFKLLSSPWSPPAWMKTNDQMNRGGKLKADCGDAWAGCYAKFIQAYAAEGVPIWGTTVQNEPAAVQPWDSCVYTPEDERDFVRDHLGPVLDRAGLDDVKIVVWDHNRDHVFERARVIFDDPEASRRVWGAGLHWYSGDTFDNLQSVHELWPDKKLLFTEGCQEGGPHHGSWLTGERYAHAMIGDFNHWVTGWIDWNMVLDETGGPNHVGNLCSAPILADTRTGELHYQSSYFYIGHFCRFVKPGARRIACSAAKDDLEAVAFRNPDGSLVTVVLNRSETPRDFVLKTPRGWARLRAGHRSIQTIVQAS